MPLGGHGRGDRTQVGDVLGVARPGPPGVVVVGRQPGEHPAAGHQMERVQGGGAPAPGGGVGGPQVPGTGQQGHGLGQGKQQGGHIAAAYAALFPVAPHDRDPGDPHTRSVHLPVPGGTGAPQVGGVRKGVPFRVPERDTPLARERGGQENGGAAQQAADGSVPRRRCDAHRPLPFPSGPWSWAPASSVLRG